MEYHHLYMNRCLELASNGFGHTYPNPMVGSVIIHNGKIIGEGWHKKAGEPHAEVNAINAVKDKSLLRESTIYVNLEPCSHYGKTPPCANLILEHRIPRVIVGIKDPNEKVAGRGIKFLKDGGCSVHVGVMENECYNLNKRFFTFHQKQRPYLILKWAQSIDGFVAPHTRDEKKPVWISNKRSRQLVHKWRTEEQGILVGTKTVIDDNPRLDARDWKGHQPLRIIIDKEKSIPNDFHCKDGSVPTLIFTKTKEDYPTKNLIFKTIDFNRSSIPQILNELYLQNIQSLIVEGGTKTLQNFIDSNSWDEARVFEGNVTLVNGIYAPQLPKSAQIAMETTLGIDSLKIINNND